MTTTLDDATDDQDLGPDWFTEDDLPSTDRRTKVIALWGVSIVVAILLVTVFFVRQADVGSGAPRDPATAAKLWLTKVVQGRRPDSPKSCVGPAYTSTSITADSSSRITVGTVRQMKTDHWTVTMNIASPRQTVPAHVEKHAGDFVVC